MENFVDSNTTSLFLTIAPIFQEQPLLLEDLLEQEKREQQQQHPGVVGQQPQPQPGQMPVRPQQQPQQQLQPQTNLPPGAVPVDSQPPQQLFEDPSAGGPRPVLRPQLPGGPHTRLRGPMPPGGHHQMMPQNPNFPGHIRRAGPAWQPRHPQEVTLQQRGPVGGQHIPPGAMSLPVGAAPPGLSTGMGPSGQIDPHPALMRPQGDPSSPPPPPPLTDSPPPAPPDNPVTEEDRMKVARYEQYLSHQEQEINLRLKYYEDKISKLRKTKKVGEKRYPASFALTLDNFDLASLATKVLHFFLNQLDDGSKSFYFLLI